MGYNTDFTGRLSLSKPLSKTKMNYINCFSSTRRMKRDVNILMELYNGKYGYPCRRSKDPAKIYGLDGEYFAKDNNNYGQTRDNSILDYNTPAGQLGYDKNVDFTTRWNETQKRIADGIGQPGLWCQWVIVDENGIQYLEWNGSEKFYYYVEWLKYLEKHFFKPWNIQLEGEIQWQGEEIGDIGKIIAKDGKIEVFEAEFKLKE
jgi:hypothetical protein